MGNAALAADDLLEAERCYEQGMLADPGDAALRLNLGFALLQQGRFSLAAERLQQALALRMPADDLAHDAHYLLGRAEMALGRMQQALASFAAAVQAKPGFTEPMEDAFRACREAGQHDEALAWVAKLAQTRPTTANCRLHAVQLAECGRDVEAADVLAQACAQDLAAIEAREQRFGVLFRLGRAEEALAEAMQVLQHKGRDASALVNVSAALEKLDRLEEALVHVDRALAINPDSRAALLNRMAILHGLGRLPEAVAAARHALSLWPDDVDVHVNLSLVLLLLGDFDAGWTEHEWRMRSPRFSAFRMLPEFALWRGESLEGKSIFLYGEQGFGDGIQFVRYVPHVAARAREVLLQVPQGLEPLMGELAPNCRLLPQGAPLPAVDHHCPLMGLPYALRTREDTIPAVVPYLRADSDAVRSWSERLAGEEGLKVGIAWSGKPTHVNDRNRSMALATFRQLAVPGCRFFTLQPELRGAERGVLAAWDEARDTGREMRDFSDTAALIEALDLVVTVDTSVAHLAGALGKPLWLLLPFIPDWRWLMDRPTSPWYPSARLYRQVAAKDWDTVLARVRADLAAFATAHVRESHAS